MISNFGLLGIFCYKLGGKVNADKLSWDQNGKPPYDNLIKKALTQSLETACLYYITYALENQMILFPHRWLVDAKAHLDKLLSNSV